MRFVCQVRKTSHAAMLLLLEHSLISKGTSVGPLVVCCKVQSLSV